MKISTKGRYALRLMLDLALNGQDTFVPIRSISERQEISEKYLEQIITQLSRAKLVKSARGAQGGYQLVKAPKEYTAGEILRAVEGSLAPVACLEPGHAVCARARDCITLDLYKEIQDAVDHIVDHTTLQDLVDKQKLHDAERKAN
ncbi:MAG: RrF2 family transcriptional regulator [Acidaminococcus sp.]|jgi:Rrf2 family protein|nr:RrF2 family transcriptional regulator [Acidaminococcus sp.]MCI2099709.1 RrF2 family transcriptional regulator [Acidaminococcus sp.]MCI2113887.1 RrF2 family transcriptional regulator [Acidaminococcus sp.]MCI2115877.1 RrF2 family transcriptional regulator [Acidaminococcus sp.]